METALRALHADSAVPTHSWNLHVVSEAKLILWFACAKKGSMGTERTVLRAKAVRPIHLRYNPVLLIALSTL
jgi:hypothetical protein